MLKKFTFQQTFNRIFSSSWFAIALIALTVLLGMGIRLFDLTDPPLDFHPVRQLRSALIARSVYYQNTDAVSAEERGLAADMASLEVYEPPIFEQIVGWSYVLGGGERVWYARVFNALFWAAGGLAIYDMLRRRLSMASVLVGLLLYFFLPFSVVASRSFQPEPWMVMWILLTAWGLDRWASSKSWKWALAAGLLGGIAILVKVVAGFFVLPMFAFVVLANLGWKRLFHSAQTWISGILMVLPTLSYYLLFHQERSSSFLSFWVGALSWMVATTEFYGDWLAMIKALTGLMTLVLALLGVLLAERSAKPWLLGGWAGYAFYGLVFPYQYVTHEYYHLPLVALAALSLPFVFQPVYEKIIRQPWFWRLACTGVIVFAAFYSLYVSRSVLIAQDYRSEPAGWERVAEAIPQDASFIALTADYGMRLRYFGGRVGASWPSEADLRLKALSSDEAYHFQAYFDELTAGKDYFVVTALSQLEAQADLKGYLNDHYPLFVLTDDFVIYQLDEKPQDD